MGRNKYDAMCLKCGGPFECLIGNFQICEKCLSKEAEEKKKGQKSG